GEGFLLERVEQGEHWGGFASVGRAPALTLAAHGRHVEVTGTAAASGLPRDEGIPAALDALLSWSRAPAMPDLPPFHGGLVGHLGYDVVREIERLPDAPADDLGYPDAVLSLTGHVTAFDHFRQRLFLVENVFLTPGSNEREASAAYGAAATRLEAHVDTRARPRPNPPSP